MIGQDPIGEGMSNVATCLNCGKKFAVSAVRADWEEFGEEYGEEDEYNDDLCSDCAMPSLQGVMNHGRAILMMNGDEDYDGDFVDEWL
jgi:hypothetical protein